MVMARKNVANHVALLVREALGARPAGQIFAELRFGGLGYFHRWQVHGASPGWNRPGRTTGPVIDASYGAANTNRPRYYTGSVHLANHIAFSIRKNGIDYVEEEGGRRE
jgi:hypothetical protein